MQEVKQEGYIPEFSGNPSDLDDFVSMILQDMTLDQLAHYADGFNATEPVITPSGYLLPRAAIQGEGTDNIAGVITDFPMPIHVGETWNLELAQEIGEVMGNERRGQIESTNPNTLIFAAIADVRHNPLCGRYYEGYSEDPFLSSDFVDRTGYGILGSDSFYIKAQICTKHYSTYVSQWLRESDTNFINSRAFREYHVPAFLKAIENDHLIGMMTSFAANNGIPNVASPYIQIMRDAASFTLRNVADYNGGMRLLWYLGNGIDPTYSQTPAEVAAIMIKGKVLNNDHEGPIVLPEHYVYAIEHELFGLTRSDMEEFIRPHIEVWVRGGYFNLEDYPYKEICADYNPATSVDENSQRIALQAAEEGIILLKNDNNVLPLASSDKILATGMYLDYRVQAWYSTETPENIEKLTFMQALNQYLGDENSPTYAPELTGNQYRFKNAQNGKYLVIQEDQTILAAGETAEDASVFQMYDWGGRAYSFINLDSDSYISADLDGNTVFMQERNQYATMPILTFEDTEDGYKVMRYAAIYASFWEKVTQQNAGIEFFQRFLQSGQYLTVDDQGKLFLGNLVTEGYSADAEFEAELVSEAGEGIAGYVADHDYAVVFIGDESSVNGGEIDDRPNLNFGANQLMLVNNVANAFPGKTVVVFRADFPMAVEELKNNPNIAAIIYSSYAGQFDSYAMIRTLFGDNNPSGKLTATWLRDISSLPPLKEPAEGVDPYYTVDMKNADPIQTRLTYLYHDADDVTYEFGYGLSYTSFEYSNLTYQIENDHITVEIDIANTGDQAGREVIQIFAACLESAYGDYVPRKQLVAFTKTSELVPGETERVTLSISYRTLEKWDVIQRNNFLETAAYRFWFGAAPELSFTQKLEGRELGVMKLDEARNVWNSIYASEGTRGREVSKRRTVYFEGDYEAVESVKVGDYVIMPKVDLTSATGLELVVASTNETSDIKIYSGSIDNEPICSVSFSATEPVSYYLDTEETILVTELSYTTVHADISPTSQVEDLYLMFGQGDIRIDSIKAF